MEKIQRVPLPSPAEFKRLYLKGPPVLFERPLAGWPAFEKWSFDWFQKQHGHINTVVTLPGLQIVRMTVGEYLTKIQTEGAEVGYLSNIDLSHRIPELASDVRLHDYTWIRKLSEMNFWLGPKGTLAQLHCDFGPNLFTQVVGRKKFIMFSPHLSKRLKPIDVTWYSAYSAFDLSKESQSSERPHIPADIHPDYEFTIEPGELLYIPVGWWHRVRSLEPSISVNTWWWTPAEIPSRGLDRLTMAISTSFRSALGLFNRSPG